MGRPHLSHGQRSGDDFPRRQYIGVWHFRSLHSALDTRDGKRTSLDSNSVMTDQMAAVDGSPVWSILDQKGTQAMMSSVMGDASKIGDYDSIKKRILASRYTMNFASGVDFDLTVVTSDSMTAATLSTVFKGVMLYKKMNASAIEKTAIDAPVSIPIVRICKSTSRATTRNFSL